MKYVEHLQGILDEEKYGEYYGGSLSFKQGDEIVTLNVSGKGFILPGNTEYTQSPEEHLLACKIYLKYKTPEHDHYAKAKEVVAAALKPLENT